MNAKRSPDRVRDAAGAGWGALCSAYPYYSVPSCVADQESVARYFHLDLPTLEDAVLAHELRESEAALATILPRWFIGREWWSGRRLAVLAEKQRRAARGVPDPSEGMPRRITVEVE